MSAFKTIPDWLVSARRRAQFKTQGEIILVNPRACFCTDFRRPLPVLGRHPTPKE